MAINYFDPTHDMFTVNRLILLVMRESHICEQN